MVNIATPCAHLTVEHDLSCAREEGHEGAHGCYDIRRKNFYKWTDTGLPIPASVHEISDKAPEPKSVLDEAKSIVAGARATEYGEGAENSLPRIASYWSTYLGRELSARDAANMMVLLKMARESHKPKRDNHVDAIGYLALAEQCDGTQSG